MNSLRLGLAPRVVGSIRPSSSLRNIAVAGHSVSWQQRRTRSNDDGEFGNCISCQQHRHQHAQTRSSSSGLGASRWSSFSTTVSNAGLPVPLPFEESKFNSATVDIANIQVEDTADFALKLFATVDKLRKDRKAAMWLKLPTDFCHYISIASHYGFQFHHTQPKYIMMYLWLPEDVPDKVPAYGTHHLGVAGCVMNDNQEVLLVKDRHEGAMWKFPGGLADLGEGIGEAAVREVWEETGVETEFRSVLSMRHQHKVQFGNSDLYFICRLMPKRTGAGALDITKCNDEIADACWMPLEQFKKQTRHSMLAVVADMLDKPEHKELTRSLHESAIIGRPPYFLYHRHSSP
ncbi:unnamed protein product [Pylaiella littoralis]